MLVPENHPDNSVCVIGLGYVGLTLSVAMADVGFRVYGIETLKNVRESIETGEAQFSEVGLNEHLSKQVAKGRITVSETIPENCPATVFIITVGTPLQEGASINMKSITAVADMIADQLKPDDLIILRSTVKTGTSRNVVMPRLEVKGVKFDLAFCPERTLEGKALIELRSLPQVIGGLNEDSTLRATQIFNFLTPTIVRVSSLEEAEMVKLINNTQRDLWFAFANEVAHMCDALKISSKSIINASNMGYPRSNVPLPGPVGGPCLGKDPHILAEGLNEAGYNPELSLTGRLLNEHLPAKTVGQIVSYMNDRGIAQKENLNIAILGLAFKGKPETDDLRGSTVVHILRELRKALPDASYKAFDPVVRHEEFGQFDLTPCDTLEDAFENSDLIVIQNNHRCFASMPLAELAKRMAKPGLVYDYWNQFNPSDLDLDEGSCYGGIGTLYASCDQTS